MCRVNHDFDDYYFTIYTLNDEIITGFDDIDTLAKFFNIPLKKVLYCLRNNLNLEYNHHKVKIIVFKKDNEISLRKR